MKFNMSSHVNRYINNIVELAEAEKSSMPTGYASLECHNLLRFIFHFIKLCHQQILSIANDIPDKLYSESRKLIIITIALL